MSYSDLETQKKLDQPLIAVYQCHPGADLPQASHLARATNALADSITTTRYMRGDIKIELVLVSVNQLHHLCANLKSSLHFYVFIVNNFQYVLQTFYNT